MAYLKSDHGKYLCWDRGINRLVANRDEAQSWEDFEITLLSNGMVAIRPVDQPYLTVETDGTVVARGVEPNAWEQWFPERINGKIAFRSNNEHALGYLTAELDGSVVVRSATPDAWQQWSLESTASNGGSLEPSWGPVQLRGEIFADNRGSFVPVGLHFGEAFSAFCRGRESEVENQLTIAVTDGYNFHRTWGNLGYYNVWRGREVAFTSFRAQDGRWVTQTENYYGKWEAYLQMCERIGIRVAVDDGDMNSLEHSAIRDHLRKMRTILDKYPHVVFSRQLANEKWQNFPPDVAEDENFAVSIMKDSFGGSQFVLGNSAPPPGDNDFSESGEGFAHMVNEYFPLGIVHGTREFDDMEKVMRRFFNYGYERYPQNYRGSYGMISLEPGGPGSGVTVGRTEDVWKIVGMHVATLIGRTATVYMSGNGVFWDGPIHTQPGYAEVGMLRGIFPSNSFEYTALHGNRSDAWFTSEGGFADEGRGYGRVDQLVSESNRFGLCIAHSGKGTRRIVTRRSVSVVVMSLDLKVRFVGEFQKGQSFDVGGDAFFTATLL